MTEDIGVYEFYRRLQGNVSVKIYGVQEARCLSMKPVCVKVLMHRGEVLILIALGNRSLSNLFINLPKAMIALAIQSKQISRNLGRGKAFVAVYEYN